MEPSISTSREPSWKLETHCSETGSIRKTQRGLERRGESWSCNSAKFWSFQLFKKPQRSNSPLNSPEFNSLNTDTHKILPTWYTEELEHTARICVCVQITSSIKPQLFSCDTASSNRWRSENDYILFKVSHYIDLNKISKPVKRKTFKNAICFKQDSMKTVSETLQTLRLVGTDVISFAMDVDER